MVSRTRLNDTLYVHCLSCSLGFSSLIWISIEICLKCFQFCDLRASDYFLICRFVIDTHLSFRNFSLNIRMSLHSRNTHISFFMTRRDFPSPTAFLISLSFRIPSRNHANPFLSFMFIYSFLRPAFVLYFNTRPEIFIECRHIQFFYLTYIF